MHKFDKIFQNKSIMNKIFVFDYAQINLRKSQKISTLLLDILYRNYHLKRPGKNLPHLYRKQLSLMIGKANTNNSLIGFGLATVKLAKKIIKQKKRKKNIF